MNVNPVIVLVAVIVVTLLLTSTVIGLGYLGSLIVTALTAFLDRNLRSADAGAANDAARRKAPSAGASPPANVVGPAPHVSATASGGRDRL